LFDFLVSIVIILFIYYQLAVHFLPIDTDEIFMSTFNSEYESFEWYF